MNIACDYIPLLGLTLCYEIGIAYLLQSSEALIGRTLFVNSTLTDIVIDISIKYINYGGL